MKLCLKCLKLKKKNDALIIFIYSYFFWFIVEKCPRNYFVQNFAYKLFKNKIVKR